MEKTSVAPVMIQYGEFKSRLDTFVKEVKTPVDVLKEVTKILMEILNLDWKHVEEVLKKENKIKVIANLKEIRGIISTSVLPTYTLTNSEKSRDVKLLIPKAEFNIEGLDQREYLLGRAIFLMSLYGKYCWYPVSAVETLPDNAVLDLLSRELWIAINAIRLRQAYEACNIGVKSEEEVEGDRKLKKQRKKELESRIGEFVEKFLAEYGHCFSALDIGDEIILPIGTQHHAMYMALVKLKDNNVLLRLDDLGLISKKFAQPVADMGSSTIPPYVIDVLPVDVLYSKKEYLVQLCRMKLEVDESQYSLDFRIPKLYLRGQQSLLDLQVAGYPEYEELKIGNCVVQNFSVGTRIRNHDVLGTGDSFCRWLNEQELQYLDDTLFSGCTKARDNRLMGFVNVGGRVITIKHETVATAIGTDILGVDINNVDVVEKLLKNIPKMPDEIIKAVHYETAAGRKDAERARAEAYKKGESFHQKTVATFTPLRIDLSKPATQPVEKETPSTGRNNKYGFFQPDSPRTLHQKEQQKSATPQDLSGPK